MQGSLTANKSVFEKKMFVEVGFSIGAMAGEALRCFSRRWSTMLSSCSYSCKVALGAPCCCSQGQLWVMLGCVCVQTAAVSSRSICELCHYHITI